MNDWQLPYIKNLLKSLLTQRRETSRRLQTGVNPFSLERGFMPPDPYPPPASDIDLELFHQSTGVTLPSDVVEWLRITNGCAGSFGISSAQDGCRVEEVWSDFPEWKKREWIPVGRDGFGNYYVKPVLPNSPVRFVESLNPAKLEYAVASDTLRFARFCLEEEKQMNQRNAHSRWPFDKDYVLRRDPDLIKFADDLAMPWDES